MYVIEICSKKSGLTVGYVRGWSMVQKKDEAKVFNSQKFATAHRSDFIKEQPDLAKQYDIVVCDAEY